jgi:hypothetical protein
MFSKGISYNINQPKRKASIARGFWHLTLCTLLSSQGSDAPAFGHHDRPAGQLLYLTSSRLVVNSAFQPLCEQSHAEHE